MAANFFNRQLAINARWLAMVTPPLRSVSVAAWIALAVSLALASYHYLAIKHSFFDDVFIYLHMARNAVESGTWQYFPVVDRSALLASSPYKLVLLTMATALASLIGLDTRTLDHAQFILLLSGVLGWLAFAPFWRGRLAIYALAGSIYFLLATVFSSVFDFEGGLLFLWIFTLLGLLAHGEARPLALALLLPVGGLIRPDLALIVYVILVAVAATDSKVRQRIVGIHWAGLLVAPGIWIILSLLLSVHPIPVTYWTKTAIPTLVEQEFFLQRVFERVGLVMNASDTISPRAATMLGVLLFGCLASLSLPRLRNPVIVGLVAVIFTVTLFGQMPGSFWWYYENVIMLLMAVFLSGAIFELRPEFRTVRIASTLTLIAILTVSVSSKALRDQPTPWSFTSEEVGRAKGYLYLAQHANGNGTYTLPEVGQVLIKNPEMGIIAYFTGKSAWIWDGAGLAQPLDVAEVRNSRLRYAYPPSLRLEAAEDAQKLVDRIGQQLPVVEVWAMEDRNYEEARKKCRFVIVAGALCINPFRELAPHALR